MTGGMVLEGGCEMGDTARFVIGVLVLMGVAGAAYAQSEADTPQETGVVEQPAATPGQPEALPAATPPPGEEVMRPTKHGIRFTPKMAKFLATNMVNELDLDPADPLAQPQKSQLADAIARRMMSLGHAYGTETYGFVEYMYESLIEGNGKIPPDSSAELAKRAKRALPAVREFFDRLPEDAGPILNEEQVRKLTDSMSEPRRMIERFEAKMDRWANGERGENEQPFDGLEDNEQAESGTEGEAETEAKPAPLKSQEMRNAELQANGVLLNLGEQQWKQFLAQAGEFLAFTDEQYAAGRALLADYRTRLDAIATPELKARVRRNRLQQAFRRSLGKEPLGPWLYHLDREYAEMVAPVKELGRSFRRDVFALATAEQRSAALAEIEAYSTQHGIGANEISAETLHLAGDEGG